MAKLTKAQAKAHQQACGLLEHERLSDDDKLFVLEHWQESAKHINTIAGAFFTPMGLARDLSVEVSGKRIIDLCAGIGSLSFWCACRAWNEPPEIVCVEMNADYAEVGRKLLPEARWIVGSVFDLPSDLGHFDFAIGNPPFGATPRDERGPRYTGREFELHVIDVASDLADFGAFIVPQMTAPFRYSGCPAGGWPETRRDGIGSGFVSCPTDIHSKLLAQTGIVLEPSCGIDTALYRSDWHGVSVSTEVVTVDFLEARARRLPAQAELFGVAA
jgi:predicted RNA methylase